MPGGSNCAIFGCSAQRSKCRGLSFHKLPKKGVNDRWRSALIAAINRVDLSFNPDAATICSRHFKESCFVNHTNVNGKRCYLIPGSLPTKWMPQGLPVSPNQFPWNRTMLFKSAKSTKICGNTQDLLHDFQNVIKEMDFIGATDLFTQPSYVQTVMSPVMSDIEHDFTLELRNAIKREKEEMDGSDIQPSEYIDMDKDSLKVTFSHI
ncbi:uncharacterized protein LOC106062658 [Biomphalaria glabrata]|uniref:Uncharacterized protein LOC106062658 n=1 Tax=Biomphalaria glabrata TaxID=6526 RepID=A0A9W2YW48_BIOGL|nr:uncharacterized protein LOC106062658 [Biomphalaria glabrata]